MKNKNGAKAAHASSRSELHMRGNPLQLIQNEFGELNFNALDGQNPWRI
jgi:hypothetical protein